MSTKDIKSLRQEGRIDEALEMAQNEWQQNPSDVWAKRNLAWVLDAQCKQAAEKGDAASFLKHLDKLGELQLNSDEVQLYNTLCWRISALMRHAPISTQEQRNADRNSVV